MPLARLQRMGFLVPPFERSLWVVASRADSLEAALPELDRAAQQRPGYPLVLSAATAAAAPTLRRLEGSEYSVATPRLGVSGAGALGRTLRALRPALVLLLDPLPGLARRLRARGLRVLEADGTVALGEQLLRALPALPDPRARLSFRRPHLGLRIARMAWARAATRMLGHRCLADWDRLGARLGSPTRILCLGNGPSSADLPPRAAADASLFRVNWIWRRWTGAGTAAPDLVVVGNTRLPRTGRKPVLVFAQRDEATYTFLRQVLRGNLRRFDYLVMSEQDSALTRLDWPAKPSGGVIMLAVATALAPAQLTVAGIDLYRHAAGRYPGGPALHNAYARAHDRETEVAMILALLRDYAGDLEVHGDPLREALAARSKVA